MKVRKNLWRSESAELWRGIHAFEVVPLDFTKRQPYLNFQATAGNVHCANRSAVKMNGALRDSEPQTCTACFAIPGILNAEKGFENVSEMSRWNAWTVVPYGKD